MKPRWAGVRTTICSLLACAVFAGLVAAPAAALRVMSDDETAGITVAWVEGSWENFRNCESRMPCCPCSIANCTYVEWCYGTKWDETPMIHYLVADCDLTKTSPGGCTVGPALRKCCRWYDMEAQDPINKDYCLTPLGWTPYYKGLTDDYGYFLMSKYWFENPCG